LALSESATGGKATEFELYKNKLTLAKLLNLNYQAQNAISTENLYSAIASLEFICK